MITECDIFLSENDFAVPVVFTPSGEDDSVSFNAILYRPGDVVQISNQKFIAEDYYIEAPEESVAGAGINSTAVISSTTYYTINEPIPDGNGFSKIRLSTDQV